MKWKLAAVWLPWAVVVAWLAWPGPTTIGPWSHVITVDDTHIVLVGDEAWAVDLGARTYTNITPPAIDGATCLRLVDERLVPEPGSPVTSACRSPAWAADPVPLAALVPATRAPPPAPLLVLLLLWPALLTRGEHLIHLSLVPLLALPWVAMTSTLIGRTTHTPTRPMRGDLFVSPAVVVRLGRDHAWVLEHVEAPNARWVPLRGTTTIGACLTASGATWWLRSSDQALHLSRLDYRRVAVALTLPLETVRGYRCEGERLIVKTADTFVVEVDGRMHPLVAAVPTTVSLTACMALSSTQPIPEPTAACDPAPDADWPLTHEPVPIDARPRPRDLLAPLALPALSLLPLPLYLIVRRRRR